MPDTETLTQAARKTASYASGAEKQAVQLLLDDEDSQTLLANISYPPKLYPNSFLLAVMGAIFIVIQGFSPLTLPNAALDIANSVTYTVSDWLAVSPPQPFVSEPIIYTFQLPFALFLGGLLGALGGGFAVGLFLFAGLLVLPVFAGGGGLDYVFEPGFGYLVGMLAGAILCGKLLTLAYTHAKPWKRTVLLYTTGLLGVLLVHGVGLVIFSTVMIAQQGLTLGSETWPILANWLVHLSLEPLPYDILSATIFLWFVRYLRLALYPALY